MKQKTVVTIGEHDMTLHGVTVRSRPVTENDWDVLAHWGSDPEVLWFSEGDNVQSYSLEEVQGIYREVSQATFGFIIEVEGIVILKLSIRILNLMN